MTFQPMKLNFPYQLHLDNLLDVQELDFKNISYKLEDPGKYVPSTVIQENLSTAVDWENNEQFHFLKKKVGNTCV